MAEEQARFLALVNEHRRIVHRIAGLYTTDPDDRKDLEQETLLQAWRGWPTFRGDSKFSTWLYRIALNTALSWTRRSRIVQRIGDRNPPEPVDASLIAHADERQRLHAAMLLLPETDRALLALHLDGFDHHEIAGMLGLTANHVGVKLHRIKTRLAEILKPL
jgi:RNA polymerase sigma-70 factor (ECF subfamily)